MNHLLKKTVLSLMVPAALVGCGGTDEGYDVNFGSSDTVVFENDAIVASVSENSGIVAVDLLQGASAGGEPLSDFNGTIFINQMEFEALDGFVTPQTESNTISNQTISPFQLSSDGLQLLIDTDKFAESLRACDDTDVRGATDADGNPIGDGIPDFPTSAVYNISFIIDNGVTLAPGTERERRQMTLTVNAIDDPVTEVIASAVEMPAGGTAQVIASTVPSYACNAAMTYSVADTDIASVDENGVITGVSVGSTTVTATSVDNPDASATADVTVTAAFTIAITNGNVDELGAPTGDKTVPSCVAAGIAVEPSILNGELTGSYGYEFVSSNAADMMVAGSAANGFGATGIINVSDNIGVNGNIDVSLVSGDTGATPISAVAGRSIELNVVQNLMCAPGESAHPAGFNIDFNMDGVTAGYSGNASFAASTDVVSDSAASVQLTAGSVVNDDGVPYSWGTQQVWNKQRNWYSSTYGLGLDSIGKKFKYAVWVKLNSVPSSPVTLRKVIVPWIYEGIPAGAQGFPGRFDGAGMFSVTLESTTEWQYIEFTDDATGESVWAVPDSWNVVTDVFTLWEVFGLPQGESLILDDYSVVAIED